MSVLRRSTHETLGNIAKLCHQRWNPEEYQEDTFRYIEINSVSRETGEASYSNTLTKEAPSRAQNIVRKNDIIISLTRPHHGSIALIDNDLDGCIASTGFAVLREIKDSTLNRRYLYSVLRSQFCLNQMLQRSSGGNYPAITTDHLMRILIPIPPPGTQNHIATFVRSAYAQKKQKEQEADTLLDSIGDYVLSELEIEMPEVEKKKSFVVYAGEIEGRFDPLYLQNISPIRSFKTPYPLTPLVKLLSKKPQYGANERAVNGNPETDVRYIRITDIDDYGNLLDDWKTAETIDSKYLLEENDVLFARSGSVGRAFVYKNEFGKAIFAGYMIRFKFDPEKVNPSFVLYYSFTKIYKLWLQSIQRTAAQPNINSKEFQSLEIPLPPLDIQNRIVTEVDKRLARVADLRQEADTVVEQAKKRIEQILLQ